jgi:hypothetical protein
VVLGFLLIVLRMLLFHARAQLAYMDPAVRQLTPQGIDRKCTGSLFCDTSLFPFITGTSKSPTIIGQLPRSLGLQVCFGYEQETVLLVTEMA